MTWIINKIWNLNIQIFFAHLWANTVALVVLNLYEKSFTDSSTPESV